MTSPTQEHATSPLKVAVMFADVCGSTQLYERLGDEQALVTMSRCLEMARDAAVGCGGRLVKTIGDEAMLVFPSAGQAATAAVEIQERMSNLAKIMELRLDFRIGFHFGDAIERDGDVFGDSVNTAARLVGIAKAGQILTSAPTMDIVPPLSRPRLRDLDVIDLKGKSLGVRVLELIWQVSADLTMIGRRPVLEMTGLEIRYGTSTAVLDVQTQAITLGRDEHNHVVIHDQRASRTHARIERRRDRFALIDASANGTYVTFEGEREFLLHHQECMLKGRGMFNLGHPHEPGVSEPVSFVCKDSGAT